MTVRDVFDRPTLAGLAAALNSGPQYPTVPAFGLVDAADRALLPPDAVDAWPLTKLQSGMIYHALLDEDSPVYHDIFDYELVGVLDVRALCRAVRETVAAHPQLRSYVDIERYAEPLQIVLSAVDVPVSVTDFTGWDTARQSRAVGDWREAEQRRPIDFGGPMIRFHAHVLAADRISLGVSFHHLILDGWSVALVVEEIRRRCAGPLDAAAPPPPGYAEYVAAERESTQRPGDRDAWRRLLDGVIPTLVAGPRAGGAVLPATVERIVAAELDERLRDRAAALGVPVKSLYLAAHGTALADQTSSPRVITGVVTNGRLERPGAGETVGLFLNTVPFRIEVPDHPGTDLATAVFARERQILQVRRFPLADIEQLYGGPLFDVVFNYTDFHAYAAGDEPVRIEQAHYFELTSFPMVVHVHRDRFAGTIELAVAHDAGSVKAEFVDGFLDTFLAALEAFAAPGAAGEVPDPAIPPVSAVVASVLGVDTVEADTNYLDAGIDSISAIRVLAKLRKLYPGTTMRDVIEARTVRALARRRPARSGEARAEKTGPDRVEPADRAGLPAGVIEAYPITATQLQMITATRRDPAQSAYHDVFAYTVALPLDETVLRTELRRTTDAHETLRTAFDPDAAPEPLQYVYASVEPDLVVDLSGRPGAADEWFDTQRGSGFDWAWPGLVRYAAHRLPEAGFVLSLSFHHAIVDGWSLSQLITDLLKAYAAGVAGDEPAAPLRAVPRYREYVLAEVSARSSAASAEHWRDVLAGHPGTKLPRYRADPAGPRWTETTAVVPAEQEAGLRAVARRAGCGFKHLMLAAHLRTLALLTGEDDVVTGVFTHGRPEVDGGTDMIGMFLHFQPHRLRLGAQTWLGLVDEVFAADARSLPHRRYRTADLGPAAVFPALFNYTEFPAYAAVAAHDRLITDVRWFEHVDVPFLVNVGRDISQARLEVTVNADGRLLPQDVTDGIARLYTAVLAHIAEHPDAGVSDPTDEIRALTATLRGNGDEQWLPHN